ncbi:hypothetical protein Q5H92_13540 [Hymenobacter sp. M29]|uniref:DUF3298 domain-containing protein n=1 Tax=Hymenobacter mellowenesis TaxID=3063995 RepID=A0ABT9AFD4_9BACT|nr:hypothetical protein [Hymenobacter sp. M29]MDO7847387.1 hypothetical protein [Hymenobacter sp. M29]
MRFRFSGLLWLLLASVVEAPAQTPLPALPPPRFDHNSTPGPRHWRGTIGQQAVTLELDSGRWGYHGQYYYDRRGRTLGLSQESKIRKGRQTELVERDDWKPTGTLLFNGPLRAQLTGTWRSPDGRRTLPVALHETHADALAYDEETWEVKQFIRGGFSDSTRLDSVELRQYYLNFRRPQGAIRPPSAALGLPVPRPRMNQYVDSLLRTRHADQFGYFFYGDIYVMYNSNHLFSVVNFEHFMATGDEGMGTHEWSRCSTYDLRTGRRLTLADMLMPGYGPQLRRCLQQQLKPIWANVHYSDVGANGKLPASGFLVTGTGLTFSYDDRDDESLGFPGPYHADRSITVEVPYEALLPIVRPTGPLAALLRERHLLPKKPVP